MPVCIGSCVLVASLSLTVITLSVSVKAVLGATLGVRIVVSLIGPKGRQHCQ